MNEEQIHRKLSAIFSADVAGYSRLMRDDELATVKLISEYRQTMADLIIQHKGRVVDSPGDNLLAEFSSVVDAVQSAVAIQREIKARNKKLSENRKMEFRIGINIGDVIQEGERIYGDGVNIASRLEGLADPGGICISRTAYDQIESKLPFGYEYLGERVVKNINKPVYAYRVIIDEETKTQNKKDFEDRKSQRNQRHSGQKTGEEHIEHSFRQVKGRLMDFAKEMKDDEELAETYKEIKGQFRTFADNISGSPEQRRQALLGIIQSKYLQLFLGIAGFLFLINLITSFRKWWFQYPLVSVGLVLYLLWVKNAFFTPDRMEALQQRILDKELLKSNQNDRNSRERRAQAEKRANARVHFYVHLYTYIGINAFLIIINLLTNPFNWWFPFPLLGWSIILFSHWIKLHSRH